MRCKYNEGIPCDRTHMVCNGCMIKKAIFDERQRVLDAMDQYGELCKKEKK